MELITFNCSSCQQILKVSADNAGKQAKCPRCGATMIIPNASSGGQDLPPVQTVDEDYDAPRSPRRSRRPDDEFEEDRPGRSRRREGDYDDDDRPSRSRRRDDDYDDDRDRPRRRRDRYDEEDDYDRPRREGMSARKKWGFVKLGLLLIAISACVMAGGAGLFSIGQLIGMIATFANKAWRASMIIGRIGNGLIFAASIVAVVGYVFCIFVPNRYGSLALAITALSLGGVNLVFSLICRIIPMLQTTLFPGMELALPGWAFTNSLGGAFALSLIIHLVFFAEFIIFPLFLQSVARAMRARSIRTGAMLVLIFASISAGLAVFYDVMVFVALNKLTTGSPPGKALQVITEIIGLLASLCFLAQSIIYILVLFRARDVIEE
jgi:hypothetical protein